MYGSQRSKLYHSNPLCAHCRVKNPVRLPKEALRTKQACRQCISTTCTACMERTPIEVEFACGHSYCRDCADIFVTACGLRRDTRVRCPCGDARHLEHIPADILQTLVSSIPNVPCVAETSIRRIEKSIPIESIVFATGCDRA